MKIIQSASFGPGPPAFLCLGAVRRRQVGDLGHAWVRFLSPTYWHLLARCGPLPASGPRRRQPGFEILKGGPRHRASPALGAGWVPP